MPIPPWFGNSRSDCWLGKSNQSQIPFSTHSKRGEYAPCTWFEMKQANRGSIVYRPAPGGTPETERAVLAVVYHFILNAGSKKGTDWSAPEARKDINGSGRSSIP